jgi:RND family efflux transporter MFP subunit
MARRRRGKGNWKLWLVLLVAVAAGVYFWRSSTEPKDAGPKAAQAVPVVLGDVTLRDIPVYVNGIGSVLSPHQVVVRSRVDGELMQVYFTEGQEVKKGQLLAEIDPRPIRATLAQARAERARIDAQLKTAILDETRYRNLLKEDAIARQQVDQQEAQVQQLRASLAAAEAVIQAAEVQLNYTRIASPANGRVGIRQVDAGNLIRANDANGLVTVTQMHPIQVLFTLPQEALPKLQKLSPKAKTPVEAWTKEGGEKLASGHLEVIDNVVDSSTGTVRLKAEFANKDYTLWPGQFVVARVQIEVLPQALSVPVRAIARGREGNFVWRIRSGRAETVDVTILHEDDDYAVVADGLSAGDKVVIDGQLRLKPDAEVAPVAADAAPANATQIDAE